MKRSLLVMILVTGLVCSQNAFAVGFELALGAWKQDLSGTMAYKGLNVNDDIDIDRDLKYDDETRVYGRLKLDMPLFIPNIYLMAAPAEFDGMGKKDVNFKFGDKVFTANVDFYSKVKLGHYDIGFYYGLPFIKTLTADMFSIELGLNARILDLEVEVRQDSTGINEKESATVGIPMIYAAFCFQPVERFAIEGEGRGISYSGNNVYSLIGRVKVKVFGPVFAAASYRYEKIEVDEDDVDLDIEFAGPMLELGLKF